MEKRHADTNSLKASGLKSASVKTNFLIYKILADQYQKLLSTKEMGSVKTVLDCGFGDGYFLDFFKEKFPNKILTGIDISKDSKEKIKHNHGAKNLHIGDLTDFNLNKKFDLVHSFDVLYHILSEADYRSALSNIANHSSKYVVLHERFFTRVPLLSSSHVRARRREVTNQILNSNGFYLYSEIPSHFLGMRMFSSIINKITPTLLHRLDQRIATSFPDYLQEALASHSIRVYKKSKHLK